MRVLDELPKPTIARVQGAAFGGGVGLVACCDIAISVPEAKFGLTEAKLGLLPAVISPYVIAAIGARNARRYFASAEIFDAAEALRIGLLHQVVPAGQLDAAVQRQIDLLLKAGPVASASAKRLVRDVASHSDGARHDADNAALIAKLRVSPEGQEGLSAFLDKRKPHWTI
jgi:methylglutaconyl-CoA hydratase